MVRSSITFDSDHIYPLLLMIDDGYHDYEMCLDVFIVHLQ